MVTVRNDKIEVLVATMNQINLNKVKEMNIQSDVIFANQSNKYDYIEEMIKNKKVKMITTPYRGVGRNRNIGLMASEAEICILADDDMKFSDFYPDEVKKAFKKVSKADVLIFNINTIPEGKVNRRRNTKIKRVHFYNVLNYGAARISFKREKVLEANIDFSLVYGGGAKYSCGEDTLFLMNCLKKGLKIYTYPYEIATVYQYDSTWFKGYNEKYFKDKGHLFNDMFGIFSIFLNIIFSIKYSQRCSFKFYKILQFMKNK
ncbi:glycosyltransferase [Absiella sp. AM29-15]|uniref:glycosyltransferase n=1 Tax=Absiella sp. AM29-15 TaxID=2292278 RepID=UPI000E41DD09|nr:glycosyltransferase [Absiella sp. AM29-15]RGC45097.1 glycosyltransferase [Absiella sp. AM29-15]